MHNKFFAVIVLVVLAIVGYFGYQYKNTKRLPDIKKITDSFTSFSNQVSEKSPQVKSVSFDASSQLQTLSERAGEVGQHAQNVLGSSIQVNEEEKKPIAESAIEYGRYIYCKQVVTEYEAAMEKSKDEKPAADEDTK